MRGYPRLCSAVQSMLAMGALPGGLKEASLALSWPAVLRPLTLLRMARLACILPTSESTREWTSESLGSSTCCGLVGSPCPSAPPLHGQLYVW
jgi:hypothetical protein